MPEFEDIQTNMGGLDPLSMPVPGESLTANPDQKFPFEQPPVHTDVNEAVEDIFFRLTEKENMDEILNFMRAEIPLEDIAQIYLFSGFREGAFTPDLMLTLIEPTIYILIWMADYAGIDPVLAPEDEFDFGSEEGEVTSLEELPVPESVPESLLTKIKTKLGDEEQQIPTGIEQPLEEGIAQPVEEASEV